LQHFRQPDAVRTERDLVYLPTASELYPDGLDKISQVQVTDLTEHYEGAHRPGHFTGVATVVLKLFNIVRPDVSVFGKKDYQQYRVIRPGNHARRLGARHQFAQPVPRRGAEEDRRRDLSTVAANRGKHRPGRAGFQHPGTRCDHAINNLGAAGFNTDYFKICNAETLLPATSEDRDLVILVTAALGQTRLLDNIEISLW
jgi:pantoate--beta-alanine ligase